VSETALVPSQSQQLPQISCEAKMPNGANTTVGEYFTLACSGDMPAPLKEPVQIVFPDEKQKHSLKISKVLKNETGKTVGGELELEVYSHQAGGYQQQKFILTDGEVKYEAQGVNWQIASVLQQGDKMNPPFGAMARHYPLWLWIVIILFVVVIGAIVAHFQRRSRLRRQLILAVLGEGREAIPFRELVKQQTAQAYSQFSGELRGVQKKLSAGTGSTNKHDPKILWADLDKAFRYYLVRELLTPAFAWSRRQLLSDIKKHHRRVYDGVRRELQQTLQELEKGLGQNITLRDCEQLYQQTRETADKIYKLRVTESKRWRPA
jgi:hypothetical protein